MQLKKRVKATLLFKIFDYSRYIITRYFLQKRIKPYYLGEKNIVIEQMNDKGATFFGYYNISPFNMNGDVIYHKVDNEKIRGSYYGAADILIKRKNGEIEKIADTKSWNWQQGSMLQWFSKSNDTIIFNNYINNEYKSVIKNIHTGHEKIIDTPIYSVDKGGQFALSLNFERLALMRPDYGYFNKHISWDDMPDNKNDGIWHVDLVNNEKRLILSLETLSKFKPSKTMKNAKHKVNHIDIASSGKRFMFLHRWVGQQGRFMRLLTANTHDGGDLFYITGNSMVSHNCWKGDEEIVSFCRASNGVNKYVLFKDKSESETIIGEKDFNNDGHPSISPDGTWMLTDDYPDSGKFSGLYLFNLKKKQKHMLGRFFQPLKYKGEKRIDLHPKWSPDGKQVSIDSGHDGKRKVFLIDVESILTNEK